MGRYTSMSDVTQQHLTIFLTYHSLGTLTVTVGRQYYVWHTSDLQSGGKVNGWQTSVKTPLPYFNFPSTWRNPKETDSGDRNEMGILFCFPGERWTSRLSVRRRQDRARFRTHYKDKGHRSGSTVLFQTRRVVVDVVWEGRRIESRLKNQKIVK